MANRVKSGGRACRFKRGDRWIAAYAHHERGVRTYVTPRAESKFFPYYVRTCDLRFIPERKDLSE